ncbi:MAG TPA: V-type ATPase 116kDa subunit family protein [Coriobacteriia bacterium]|nr:V-type ATPase 116kDa subunit family protein [Coriobacteriia bacterium]
MAIARMLKASVIGHIEIVDTTVKMMQRAGVIEVTVAEVPSEEVMPLEPDEHRLGELEELTATATFVRDFLKGFHISDAPLATFVSEKVHMPASEFDRLVEQGVPESLSGECESMAERLGVIARERSRLQRLARDLAPWEGLRLQISQWTGTEHVVLFTGTVPTSAAREIRQALRDAVTDVSVAEVGELERREAWVVMAHRESLEDVRSVLSLVDFVDVSFAGLHDYPAEERARALAELAALDGEEGAIAERARALAASEYRSTVAVVQAMLTRRDAEQVRANFAGTERVFVVEGWVDASERERLEAVLASVGSELDVSLRDPREDERVPVRLVNPPFLRPFEILTDLYGRPRYGRIDPTPLLAGFFFVFFGMCVGDVGYALMLGVAAWLIKTRLDVAPRVRTFMDLLMTCSVAAALVGVATRSYFALGVESLPGFLRYEPLIDPLDDVLLLLIISVALGVAHVSVGVVTSAVQRWRDGDVLGALSVDLSTIGLFMAAGVAFAFPGVVGWLLPASLGAAIIFKGRILEEVFIHRSAKGTLIGFGRGLLGLYGLVGYASDFLSYTRLAALGLASLLVGDVMNRLAGLVAGIPFGIGIVAAILILVVGHTFNVAINLIGAFVHPTRLQFVEFFGKFYEGGGRPFAPFARRVKSVVLHPETGAREGGT